jgi:hypothetical protein
VTSPIYLMHRSEQESSCQSRVRATFFSNRGTNSPSFKRFKSIPALSQVRALCLTFQWFTRAFCRFAILPFCHSILGPTSEESPVHCIIASLHDTPHAMQSNATSAMTCNAMQRMQRMQCMQCMQRMQCLQCMQRLATMGWSTTGGVKRSRHSKPGMPPFAVKMDCIAPAHTHVCCLMTHGDLAGLTRVERDCQFFGGRGNLAFPKKRRK